MAHRTALFVLDNLEQLEGADTVVAELLDHAPQVVVIATSRRPLALPAEQVHPVPPLELPKEATFVQAESSGAVQLFVHAARRVKPAFPLTPDNAADVVEVCRRLNGLPWAVELAAARTRLLSPAALLARLDKALDLAATGSRGPTRQKTLRESIAWSYRLLTPTQRSFFRRLGVFAGGADLEAISAVTTDILDGADPLDQVADLVDASLATVADDERREPRVGMLETIRAFASEQLQAHVELNEVRRVHTEHYLALAERLRSQVWSGGADQLLVARRRFELEHDNYREARAWALGPPSQREAAPEEVALGLAMCGRLHRLWRDGGYYAEGRRWLERAVDFAGDVEDPDLGRCLHGLAQIGIAQGELDRASEVAARSLALRRRLGDQERLIDALNTMANCEQYRGNSDAARRTYEEAIALAPDVTDQRGIGWALMNAAYLEGSERKYNAALERYEQALMQKHVPELVRLAVPEMLLVAAEDYGSLLAALGDHRRAVRLIASAE